MAEVGNLADWRGKVLIDREGERIGKLEGVYVDVEANEPVFGTVKEGFIIGRHLTFVLLLRAVVSPDGLQVRVSKR
jgi:PRC-barrel domain